MAVDTDLEDVTQTTVYIPFNDSDQVDSDAAPPSLFPERDFPQGCQLRFQICRAAWGKCLKRMQELIHSLHAPVVESVVEQVKKSYTDELPGLPYPELPVVSVTSSSTSSSLFDEISFRLEESTDELFEDANDHFVTHVFPSDCTTITGAMKAIVSGFVSRSPTGGQDVKRKPSTSLAAYDIALLEAWYRAVCDARDDRHNRSRLVVIMHDFEQLEPQVVQDMFEICSSYILRLPLVFILALASPPSPSYIHATYPHSMLALLRVRDCPFPLAEESLHDILLETFFDPIFEPDVMMGPTTIDFAVEFFTRHSSSLDGLLSILQLAHMKHFEEPLSVLVPAEPLGRPKDAAKVLLTPDAFPFLDALFARVHESTLIAPVEHATSWRIATVDSILSLVETARNGFRMHAKLLRIAFRLVLLVRQLMLAHGYKNAQGDQTVPDLMCLALRGRLGSVYGYLCSIVRKLSAAQLEDFVRALHDFFGDVPDDVRAEEDEVISRVETAYTMLGRDASAQDISGPLGNWLSEYFKLRIVALEDAPLWDIWYTGSTPFPSELINPSPRASVLAGLIHPRDYASPGQRVGDDEDDELPDISILFKGYLESAKMINVYDWFESFVVVLEARKRRLGKNRVPDGANGNSRTPSRKKGKQKEVDDEVVNEDAEEDEEEWHMELQARFIRALQELDYLGFIKHTGRKADHVMRTVFDSPE
ncbi:origin recognition complex subunit 3 N-terminus-domain-containing protein [Suillus clintonianus]|uniref:origin recognition complex subunit 3 N-terminus-domain-containing protein n=1 Tax=Suillus clintonianus TaxID=1904413 RepID=UPI001B87C705|nr:origin recognition complex subunit 3 N-terminus-domain-containing protein [Suillus clintonianus]KAG2121256.1 origin recognition complex subunit 3 N-terminus-domain-containing protein [Suillus clintonianus]